MSYDLNKKRGLGDYGGKMLLGNYDSSAAELLPTATLFGLPHSMTAIWASFDDEDGNKRAAEGYCVRHGENRKLKYSSSWPEFQADGRVEKFHQEAQDNVAPGYT